MKKLMGPARVGSACIALLLAVIAAQPVAAQPAPTTEEQNKQLDDFIVQVLGVEKEQIEAPADATKDVKDAATKVRDSLRSGIRNFAQQKLEDAVKDFTAARETDKSLSPANLYLAKLCFATQDQNVQNAGRQFLERAVATSEGRNEPEPYLLFGRMAVAGGRLTDAELNFAKALSLVPDDSSAGGAAPPDSPAAKWTSTRRKTFRKDVYANQVQVAIARGELTEAQMLVGEWIKIDADDAQALFRQGQIEYQLNVKDKKIDPALVAEILKTLQSAYDLAKTAHDKEIAGKEDRKDELPPLPPAELVLIQLHTANGVDKEAEDAVKALEADAAKLYGENPKQLGNVLSSIAMWYMQKGKISDAVKAANAAMAADSKAPALKKLSAMMQYLSNDPSAKETFKAMNIDEPGDFMISNTLALILCESEAEADKTKAVQLAEINAQLNQNSMDALSTLCWVYYKTGRKPQALQAYGLLVQALQKGAQLSGDTAYFMSQVAIDSGADEAEAYKAAKLFAQAAVDSQGTFKHRDAADAFLKRMKFSSPAGAGGGTAPRTGGTTPPAGGSTSGTGGATGVPVVPAPPSGSGATTPPAGTGSGT